MKVRRSRDRFIFQGETLCRLDCVFLVSICNESHLFHHYNSVIYRSFTTCKSLKLNLVRDIDKWFFIRIRVSGITNHPFLNDVKDGLITSPLKFHQIHLLQLWLLVRWCQSIYLMESFGRFSRLLIPLLLEIWQSVHDICRFVTANGLTTHRRGSRRDPYIYIHWIRKSSFAPFAAPACNWVFKFWCQFLYHQNALWVFLGWK